MVDLRNNLSRQVEAEVRQHFADRVYRTRIPRNVRLSEAPSHGQPILLYDIHSRGAVAYLRLAEELLRRRETESSNGARSPAAAEFEEAEEFDEHAP
jgi:chromosome partitioning protein